MIFRMEGMGQGKKGKLHLEYILNNKYSIGKTECDGESKK